MQKYLYSKESIIFNIKKAVFNKIVKLLIREGLLFMFMSLLVYM